MGMLDEPLNLEANVVLSNYPRTLPVTGLMNYLLTIGDDREGLPVRYIDLEFEDSVHSGDV
jgi:hypothetical protein